MSELGEKIMIEDSFLFDQTASGKEIGIIEGGEEESFCRISMVSSVPDAQLVHRNSSS